MDLPTTVNKIIKEKRIAYTRNVSTLTGSDTLASSVTYVTGNKTFTGGRNPNWRSQIRRGISATTGASGTDQYLEEDTPYSYVLTDTTTRDTGFAWTVTRSFYGDTSFGFPNRAFASAGVANRVYQRAVAQFIEACLEARQQVQFGQDLGEWRSTLNGVKKPLASLQDHVVNHVDKGIRILTRMGKTRRAAKLLADAYLEFKFGWLPLSADLASAMVNLQTRANRPLLQPVKAYAAEGYYGTNVANSWPSTTGLRVTGNLKSDSKYSLRMEGMCRTSSASDGQVSSRQVLSLTLPDVLPTIWNLIPFTWVVDYFTNIGDMIQAASFRRSDITWAWATSRDMQRNTYEIRGVEALFPWSRDEVQKTTTVSKANLGKNGRTVSVTKKFQRWELQPDIDLLATFVWKYPTNSVKPYLNMAAILTQRLGKLSDRIF